ncbi:MAG: hypothetical protein R3F37_18770 [Candidatus Competibacteraceae bacterium]
MRVGEMAELEAEHRRLVSCRPIADTCQRAQDRLYDNEEVSVQTLLSQGAQQELNALILLMDNSQHPELINAASRSRCKKPATNYAATLRPWIWTLNGWPG